ncbi:transporter [Bradyrhizobium sp. Pa8]|uniref:transporter n=1 Tax=Bradyrhizobium sp. Pa8 TaxID=3386552 RepID=UPI00403F5B17
MIRGVPSNLNGDRMEMVAFVRRPGWGLLFGALAVMAWPAMACAQTPSASTADNTGLDFFRPPPNLFQLQYEYRTAPGSTRDVTTDTLNLRYDHAFYLSPTWTVVTRTDLPLLARNTINSSNPNGDYLYGIGDADIQAAVIHDLDTRWAVGFGLRLIAPTGADPLGSGKWRTMPIVGFRMALPEISKSSYFEPIFRYDVSVAGDPTRRNISNLQFGPTLNIGLPERWFVTFFPSQDIRYNFGDPITGQTGRLFLPFDVRVGKKISDQIAASVEVGVPIVKDYPVYNFKGQFRLNVTW